MLTEAGHSVCWEGLESPSDSALRPVENCLQLPLLMMLFYIECSTGEGDCKQLQSDHPGCSRGSWNGLTASQDAIITQASPDYGYITVCSHEDVKDIALLVASFEQHYGKGILHCIIAQVNSNSDCDGILPSSGHVGNNKRFYFIIIKASSQLLFKYSALMWTPRILQ